MQQHQEKLKAILTSGQPKKYIRAQVKAYVDGLKTNTDEYRQLMI